MKKTNGIDKIIICTDKKAFQSEMKQMEIAQTELTEIKRFLVKKGIEPCETNIKNVASHNLSEIVQIYTQNENDKLKGVTEAFGENAVLESARLMIQKNADSYRNEILSQMPRVSQQTVLLKDYFEYTDERIQAKKEYDEQFFLERNSVVLTKPEDIELYTKHQTVVEYLNQLMDNRRAATHEAAFNNLFIWDMGARKYRINLGYYSRRRK